MYNEIYCKQISMRLAELVAEVRQSSASNLHSINVHAENFFRAFLNQLFGWRLSNANAIEPNAAGVDLLYRGEAGDLVVQVSSTTTHEKIQKSLEKSARFPGAHFLFLAIDDHLPNYQKGFEKHGLVFDPKEDILDTTRLCDRVVNCGDRGALRAIDIQRALADLVENYFSRTEQLAQAELSTRLGQAVSAAPARQVGGQTLQLLGAGQPDNLFVYNARAVPLLGRDEDMKKLLDFVTDEPERRFRWWAVTAPGGAGKTRLAFELQNRLLETGEWEVYVLPPKLLRGEGTGLAELSAACPGKTLLLVDYVQQHTEALHTLLEGLSWPGPDRREPLRLLLLERDIRDENGHIIWLDQVTGRDHHILAACQNRQPLYLEPLRRNAEGDPLAQIIRAFADKVCETPDPQGKPLHPLPQGKEAALRDRLEAIDPGLVRPLYALILADAWVRDPETEHWAREKLLSRPSAYALNFSANYVPFPVPTIGKVRSGLLTFSRYGIREATRISLPSPFSWPVSVVNLKRCLLVTRIPVAGSDKELVLVNLHLEAYDDGEGKLAQSKQLREFLAQEYEKGNYVLAGGDWNQIFPRSDSTWPNTHEELWTPGYLDEAELAEGWRYVWDDAVPTCRLLNQPYDPADTENTQYYVIDGFLVSPNLRVESVETIDESFTYSDHNPVLLTISFGD